jgi:signal transduction histidine kinase
MRTLSYLRGNVRFWLRGYVLLGVAVMVLAMLLYSNHLIGSMRAHAEATSRLFSRYFESVLFEVADDGSLAELRPVLQESNLPIIITVLGGRPILWHNVPVDPRTEEEFENLINLDVDNPPTEKMRRLIELYREFDEENDPIPIYVAGAAGVQGYVHFGPSPLQRELRLMPFVMLGIFLVFMAVAVQGLRFLKLSEQRSIWVGLAKETAHQLGTPLSAMLGWLQLIKDTAAEKGYTEIGPSIDEMEIDLNRLNKISDRFSKIGSRPELVRVELRPLVERTVAYFEKRMPRVRADSTISIDMPEVAVAGNEELLEWVFENLIKNALDALQDGGGSIDISARTGRTGVEVRVKDTGGGIHPTMRERVFHPGFTTKQRGWGLGLALTRRIVTEYHGGTIRLAESRRGKGATFVIRLPAAGAGA